MAVDNSDTILFELKDGTSHSTPTTYRLAPGRDYSFTCDGGDSGIWQFSQDNGTSWTSFTEGSGLNFTASIPESGLIRLNNGGSGPTLAGFVVKPR